MRRRLLLAATAAAMVLALSAPAVSAVPPTQGSWEAEWDVTTSDLCSFPVDIHVHVVGTWTQFFDQDGVQTQWVEQDVENDVFSANGETLVGLPFRLVNIVRNNPDGSWASYHAQGGVERVPLPDGSVFWSAGRIDWLGHPGMTFTITPDVGHSGNVEAFCAALS